MSGLYFRNRVHVCIIENISFELLALPPVFQTIYFFLMANVLERIMNLAEFVVIL